MKKNILLMLLSSVLLAGCSISDILPWGKKDNESEQKTPENSEENTGGNENLDELKNPFTLTINYSGSYLPSEWTDPGVVCDSTLLSSDTQNERLRNATNAQVNNSNLLSELFFTKLNTAYGDGDSLVLQIGTGDPAKNKFNFGTFIWTSVKKIYRVDISAQCYTKTLGSTDSSAHLQIEAGKKGTDKNYDRPITSPVTFDMDLSVGQDESLVYKAFSNTFPKGIDRFCLTSLGGRVFLKSISITWDLG